jgi:hypothetical protein
VGDLRPPAPGRRLNRSAPGPAPAGRPPPTRGERARAIVEALPKDRGGRGGDRSPCAAAAAKKLGGVYHAERLWLFLPSGDGLPEVQHPLELSEV